MAIANVSADGHPGNRASTNTAWLTMLTTLFFMWGFSPRSTTFWFRT